MLYNHSFSVELATQIGLEEAIILEHIAYWIFMNKMENRNFYDGKTWTFMSADAFAKHFPYLASQGKRRNARIYTILNKLKKMGAIITGNYNPTPYDRTMWYALGEGWECLLEKFENFANIKNDQKNFGKNKSDEDGSKKDNFRNDSGDILKSQESEIKNAQPKSHKKYNTNSKQNSKLESKGEEAAKNDFEDEKTDKANKQTPTLETEAIEAEIIEDLNADSFSLKNETPYEKTSDIYKRRLEEYINSVRRKNPLYMSFNEFENALLTKNYKYKNFARAYLKWNSKNTQNKNIQVNPTGMSDKTVNAINEFLRGASR